MEIKQEEKKNNHTRATRSKKTNSSDHRPPSVLVSLLFGFRIPFVVFGAQHASTRQSLIAVVCRHRPNRWSAADDKIRKKEKKKKPRLWLSNFLNRSKPPGGNGPVCGLFVSKVHFGKVETGTAPDENVVSSALMCLSPILASLRSSVHQPERHSFARQGNVTKTLFCMSAER